jgi:peptidoglycan/xylan/chitin deacetylase (PgdA/CDA1 family)
MAARARTRAGTRQFRAGAAKRLVQLIEVRPFRVHGRDHERTIRFVCRSDMNRTSTQIARTLRPVKRLLMPILLFAVQPLFAQNVAPTVAVFVYHRFADTANDSMTVRTATFEAQLRYLHAAGYSLVPLRDILAWREGIDSAPALPPKAVALTVDDGHRSVYDVLLPIALREHLPFTLFVYPSAISNAPYALTWDQLRALRDTGLVDIESHTYWHPNFNVERKRRSLEDYRRFAQWQLTAARRRLEAELGTPVDLLAWPFGIEDDALAQLAAAAGYRAAFALDARLLTRASPLMRLPRFLIVDADTPAGLARRLGEPAPPPSSSAAKTFRP